ncbi:MAG: hypothetical protein H6686_12625 [Fibrobacteria bacterium]|nr:hypothetical protein [Fibrobacteria bacterium]
MNSVMGVIDGKIVGESGPDLAYWNPGAGEWEPFPTNDRNGKSLVGGGIYGFAHFGDRTYAGGFTGSYTYQAGVWDTIANQGIYAGGRATHRWGWMSGFKVIDDTLYAYGSSVRRYNPSAQRFEEIAWSFESGTLPPGSIYANKNQGCFHMGDVRDIAKIGDTVYAATVIGLWKIAVSHTVVCPTVYNGDDTCGRVAKLEACISDPDVYCCDYDHTGFTPCDGWICPAARKASNTNPVAPGR